jgi:hypothetical protein
MTESSIPACLVWCKAWTFPKWKKLTGLEELPLSKDATTLAWKSSLTHLPNLAAVQACAPSRESKVCRTQITKCLNKQNVWDRIDRFMRERNIDAGSVAKSTGSRVPPRSYKRFLDPHINDLGLDLFGSEAKESANSCVVGDRIYAVVGEMMKMAWLAQSERLNHTTETLESAMMALRVELEGESVTARRHGHVHPPNGRFCQEAPRRRWNRRKTIGGPTDTVDHFVHGAAP